MHKTILLICAVYGSAAVAAEGPKSLTLSQAAKQFFATEPSVAQAQLAAAVAEVGVLSAQDRLSMQLSVTPSGRADSIAGGVVDTGGITGGATADFRFLDRSGGTLRTQLNARTVTAPTLFLPGNGGTLSLQYAIPLLRNRLASLWAMEVAQAQFAATAAKKTSSAMRVERCAAFLHLFVTAQSLQQQTHILEDLLQRREQTYAHRC